MNNSGESPLNAGLKHIILCQIYRKTSRIQTNHHGIFQALCQEYWDNAGFEEGVLYYNENKVKGARDKIFHILRKLPRSSIAPKSTIIVFPENVIPYSILDDLIDFATKQDIILIGGMEHKRWKEIQEIFGQLAVLYQDRFARSEISSILDAHSKNFNPESYLNLAIIINGSQRFSFQHKHIPFYKIFVKERENNEFLRENIPLLLKPNYFKFETSVGPLSLFICKDFLSHYRAIPDWMNANSIPLIVIPAFSSKVATFQSKFIDMVEKQGCRENLFALASMAEYGGSGLYCFDTLGLAEPANVQKFPGRVEKVFIYKRKDTCWNCF
ncbi:MAG: hypothetical protein RBG13Loki_1165 [Promethearchaeota archaeon CR_4]|nr:MAG: hypothetical protein RBG13Loki_1165 [Candidatus Lokiarchaeota archaeon CR_4]